MVKYATDISADKLRNADFEGQIKAIGKSQAVIEFALDGRFFRRVALEIAVDDATRSYHVPLLVAPYGVSSYRGS